MTQNCELYENLCAKIKIQTQIVQNLDTFFLKKRKKEKKVKKKKLFKPFNKNMYVFCSLPRPTLIYCSQASNPSCTSTKQIYFISFTSSHHILHVKRIGKGNEKFSCFNFSAVFLSYFFVCDKYAYAWHSITFHSLSTVMTTSLYMSFSLHALFSLLDRIGRWNFSYIRFYSDIEV